MDQLSWNMKGVYEDRFYGLFIKDEPKDKTKIKQTYGIEIPYWEESLKECIEKL